jgi:hypothetical protein
MTRRVLLSRLRNEVPLVSISQPRGRVRHTAVPAHSKSTLLETFVPASQPTERATPRGSSPVLPPGRGAWPPALATNYPPGANSSRQPSRPSSQLPSESGRTSFPRSRTSPR